MIDYLKSIITGDNLNFLVYGIMAAFAIVSVVGFYVVEYVLPRKDHDGKL